jgi:hypothetical protein
VPIAQWLKVECNQHKHFGKIVPLCSSVRRADYGLDHSCSQPSRLCCFRSHLYPSGGYHS